MSMNRVISCVVEREYLRWPVHSLGKTLLAFALPHFGNIRSSRVNKQPQSKNYWYPRTFIAGRDSSVQFSSVAQSCPTLRDPMNRSTLGLPVHHQLPELAQTHIHWVSDAIKPSHPPSPPSSCPQSFPASGSFPMSRLFASLFLHLLQYSVFLNYTVQTIRSSRERAKYWTQ